MTTTPSSVSTDPLTIAHRFLDGLAARDAEQIVSCFADDAVQDMPFGPPGFPREVAGREALRRLWESITQSFRSIEVPIVGVERFADPSKIQVEWTGRLEQLNGKPYENHYFSTFCVIDGKIARYRELYDTLAFTSAISDEDRSASFDTADPEQKSPDSDQQEAVTDLCPRTA
jgi:uncharacterized protein